MFFKKIALLVPAMVSLVSTQGKFYTKTISVFRDAEGKKHMYSKSYRQISPHKIQVSLRAFGKNHKKHTKRLSMTLKDNIFSSVQKQKIMSFLGNTFFHPKNTKEKQEFQQMFLKAFATNTSFLQNQTILGAPQGSQKNLRTTHHRDYIPFLLPFPFNMLRIIPIVDEECKKFEELLEKTIEDGAKILGKSPCVLRQKTKQNLKDGEGGKVHFSLDNVDYDIDFFRGKYSIPEDDKSIVGKFKDALKKSGWNGVDLKTTFLDPWNLERTIEIHKPFKGKIKFQDLKEKNIKLEDLGEDNQELRDLLKSVMVRKNRNHNNDLKNTLKKNLTASKIYIEGFNNKKRTNNKKK